MAKYMTDEEIDEMDILGAAKWFKTYDIGFENLESLDEMRLLIKRETAKQKGHANSLTGEYGSPEVNVGINRGKTTWFLIFKLLFIVLYYTFSTRKYV